MIWQQPYCDIKYQNIYLHHFDDDNIFLHNVDIFTDKKNPPTSFKTTSFSPNSCDSFFL